MTTPDLDDASSWAVNGSSMTAWINDLEFFEIVPESGHGLLKLTINYVAHAQSVLIGKFNWFPDAQAAARKHLGVA